MIWLLLFVAVSLGFGALLVIVFVSKSSQAKETVVRGPGGRPAPQERFLEVRVTTSRSGRVDPSPLTASPEDVWIPFCQSTMVQGVDIRGGMLYVGRGLASLSHASETEPALIDPSLPVDLQNLDLAAEGMNYWPSYTSIPPQSRGAYLYWLASGRTDPNVPIGYVFLAFYAIERRLLADTQHSQAARAEAPALLAEVERLLSIYGENRSFFGYATRLLEVTRFYSDGDTVDIGEPPTAPNSWELPVSLRVGLGRMVAEGRPIPPKWALAWFRGSNESRLRTAAKRCAEEFDSLYLKRYAKKYGEGMVLKPNKRRLQLDHHPASASFGGGFRLDVGDLPDVDAVVRPIRQMQKIADQCMQDLDAYSRYLGKNPDGRGSAPAFGMLPAELSADFDSGEIGKLRAWAEHSLGNQLAIVLKGNDVMSRWDCARSDRMSKKEVVTFVRVLQKLGVGVEPDIRFVGPAISAKAHVVLFRLPADHSDAPSMEYRAGSVFLHLAAVVAAADGIVSQEEEELLEKHLERALKLGAAEAARLSAHLKWLLVEQPGMAGLKKRLESVSDQQRARIAEFAVTVAGADGIIDPEEVKVLRKLYRTLGLDQDAVYGHINALAAGVPGEPVTVRAARTSKKGFRVPKQPTETPPGGFRLDMKRVETKLAETAAVSKLLADIFVEENDGADQPDSTEITGATPQSLGVGDLDPAHSEFVRRLKGRETVDLSDLASLADELGLLPEGAFDLINEAAFDLCDEPLFEGDDPVEINAEVMKEMLA